MDLNDAERYAVAALFTLALHSTHVETGVDKNGNSLSESDIAWGCPSEELFDEYLASQEPLKLPAALQDIFWGHDCMAHAGLAPRLYAWLKIPRKAWPGLLRMPDLAGSGAGSAAAVEAFVALVRRYSAFLDPELAFTTGHAARLQQRFSLLAGNAPAEDAAQQQPQQQEGRCSASSGEEHPPVHVPLLPTPVNPKHSAEMRMALTIAVNGCCISSLEDFVRPWLSLPSRDCDRFALVWESACLKELGGALVSFIAQQALTQVTQRTIQAFLYTGLVGALALPMTLTTAMKVAFGSKWLVALRRAQAAGKMLAMQLAQGCHGGRPVTLIGCSMGARLIFHTLLELSRLGAHGCVENVILLGAPLSCRPDRWCAARSVVSGRLINGYSVNDWTLGLLYRVHSSSSIWLQAAGIWKVDVPGVENVNLSRLVNGHSDYLTAMAEILEVINLHDV
ncbi:hypothetical protein OEZ86_010735 [Tetradesmus obliquus]|nr:hypothetical protein OEZ86_010735 [Tetradesmus obliquus]